MDFVFPKGDEMEEDVWIFEVCVMLRVDKIITCFAGSWMYDPVEVVKITTSACQMMVSRCQLISLIQLCCVVSILRLVTIYWES
jgi:hypothetical protein